MWIRSTLEEKPLVITGITRGFGAPDWIRTSGLPGRSYEAIVTFV